MRNKLSILILLLPYVVIAQHSVTYDTLANPNSSIEAVALFRFLQDMSGKKVLSGQMWAPWGIDEIDYTKNVTGRYPAIKGQDFIHEGSNANEVQHAINWWNSGGIPTIMWHWGAPGIGEGYENSKVKIDINKCFQEGTAEYNSMWSELAKKADHLEVLRDANVPVLWRPFHEFNGGWFWWGMQGSDLFEQLWITMFNYFVHDRGLNNLVWVLPYANSPKADWNPGKEYYDIAGSDTYSGGDSPQLTMYNTLRSIVNNDAAPLAFHECGIPPDPDECAESGALWSWWMIWHTDWLTDTDVSYLTSVYNHDLILTKDELPDIVAQYGWNDTCGMSTVIPRIKVDDGEYTDTNSVEQLSGDLFFFSPQTNDTGTWFWTGCNVSATTPEVTVPGTEVCSAIATFTNTCGASTSTVFTINKACVPTVLSPYLTIDLTEIVTSTEVTVDEGALISLAPLPFNGGTWKWSGCNLGGTTRNQAFYAVSSCSATATHTNECGITSAITFNITVNDTTTGKEIFHVSSFEVFPNPFRERLQIRIGTPSTEKGDLTIYASDGRIVFRDRSVSGEISIDGSAFDAGIYILQVRSDEGLLRKRIVKVRDQP